MNCECDKFEHLELYRAAVSKRIKETKLLKGKLNLLAEKDEHQLWRCPPCGQLWQGSRAWSWGAKEYLFKVPDISVGDWLAEPYMRPDEMLVYDAVMRNYMKGQTFVEKAEKCRTDACHNQAIELSVFCLSHHVEHLQNAGRFPPPPRGRIFLPYHFPASEEEA